jgi:NADPH2 dehydrogenase
MDSKLFDPIALRGRIVRNRVVMPPMVNFKWTGTDGVITDKHVDQYAAIARGGAGIVIGEATCVTENGRIVPDQPGIWNAQQAKAWKRMAKTCRKEGAVTLLQLQHAGLKTSPKVSSMALGPSPDPRNPASRALERKEIPALVDDFIRGAVRAQEAGFDGVELHGAHGYLLNQFASSYYNHREDDYGGALDGRIRLALEVIRGIRHAVRTDFIVGYRLGANSPTLEDGLRIAKILQGEDIDYLHVSHGGNLENLPAVPESFHYNWIVWSGIAVKKHATVPVIGVFGISTPERAAHLVDNGLVDMVAIGRDQLTDHEWVRKARAGEPINQCLACKPACKRYVDPERCPAVSKRPPVA